MRDGAVFPENGPSRVLVDISRLNGPEVLEAFGPLDYPLVRLEHRLLRNVTILRSGICMRGFRLVRDSVHHYAHRLGGLRRRGILSMLTRRTRMLPRGRRYAIIHNEWFNGYFHWLTESLPRLMVLRAADPDAVLLLPSHTRMASLHLETVRAAGWTAIEQLPEKDNVFARELSLVRNPPKKGEFDPEQIRAVRALYTERYAAGLSASRRVYVSRRLARGRKVVNEAEVAALLEQRGFEVALPEQLPFADQVRLFAQCEALVTIHGAGLTNIMFMPDGAKVLEFIKRRAPGEDFAALRRSDLLNPSYPRLATIAGLDYVAQLCTPHEAEQVPGLVDLVVDLDELKQSLDRLDL